MLKTEKRKFVVFVGVRAGLEDLLVWLKTQGYHSLLMSKSPSLKEAFSYDYCLDVDINDYDTSVEAINALPEWIELACFYTTNEYRVPTAAKLATELGIGQAIALDGATNCRNKKLVRKILHDNGLSKLNFKLVTNTKEVMAASMSLNFPVIVKPSNDAGSRFVFKCDDMMAACEAVSEICSNTTNYAGQDIDPEILIEEMAEGPEYSVEAYTANGNTEVIAITQKETSGAPYFIEKSHLVPAQLENTLVEEVTMLIKQAHKLVGINNVVTHTEFKLTKSGPEIIEINGRPGGDHIPELVKHTTGICLNELGAHIALGRKIESYTKHPVQANSAAVKFLLAEDEGYVSYQTDIPEHNGILTVQLSVKPGASVIKTSNNYNRLGYVLGVSSTSSALDITTQYIDSMHMNFAPKGCC